MQSSNRYEGNYRFPRPKHKRVQCFPVVRTRTLMRNIQTIKISKKFLPCLEPRFEIFYSATSSLNIKTRDVKMWISFNNFRISKRERENSRTNILNMRNVKFYIYVYLTREICHKNLCMLQWQWILIFLTLSNG